VSLLCSETNKDIEYGTTLMAGTRPGEKFYHALSEEALARIPESEKSLVLCGPGSSGINIHEATSSKNFNGNYTFSDFKLGEFLFSISKEAAEKHIPKHVALYSEAENA